MANYEILGKDNGKHVVMISGERKHLTDAELEALTAEPEAPATAKKEKKFASAEPEAPAAEVPATE